MVSKDQEAYVYCLCGLSVQIKTAHHIDDSAAGSNNRSGRCRVNEMEDRYSTKAFVLVLGVLVRALQAQQGPQQIQTKLDPTTGQVSVGSMK